jgi:hypothetical protein
LGCRGYGVTVFALPPIYFYVELLSPVSLKQSVLATAITLIMALI